MATPVTQELARLGQTLRDIQAVPAEMALRRSETELNRAMQEHTMTLQRSGEQRAQAQELRNLQLFQQGSEARLLEQQQAQAQLEENKRLMATPAKPINIFPDVSGAGEAQHLATEVNETIKSAFGLTYDPKTQTYTKPDGSFLSLKDIKSRQWQEQVGLIYAATWDPRQGLMTHISDRTAHVRSIQDPAERAKAEVALAQAKTKIGEQLAAIKENPIPLLETRIMLLAKVADMLPLAKPMVQNQMAVLQDQLTAARSREKEIRGYREAKALEAMKFGEEREGYEKRLIEARGAAEESQLIKKAELEGLKPPKPMKITREMLPKFYKSGGILDEFGKPMESFHSEELRSVLSHLITNVYKDPQQQDFIMNSVLPEAMAWGQEMEGRNAPVSRGETLAKVHQLIKDAVQQRGQAPVGEPQTGGREVPPVEGPPTRMRDILAQENRPEQQAAREQFADAEKRGWSPDGKGPLPQAGTVAELTAKAKETAKANEALRPRGIGLKPILPAGQPARPSRTQPLEGPQQPLRMSVADALRAVRLDPALADIVRRAYPDQSEEELAKMVLTGMILGDEPRTQPVEGIGAIGSVPYVPERMMAPQTPLLKPTVTPTGKRQFLGLPW